MKRSSSNCHRCPYNGRNGEGLPFDAEAAQACTTCTWSGEPSHGGVSFVSFDSCEDPALVTRGRIAADYAPNVPRAPALPSVSDVANDWLLRLCMDVADLRDPEAELVHGITHGVAFDVLAGKAGTDRRTIAEQVRAVLRAHPVLHAAIDHARRTGRNTEAEA